MERRSRQLELGWSARNGTRAGRDDVAAGEIKSAPDAEPFGAGEMAFEITEMISDCREMGFERKEMGLELEEIGSEQLRSNLKSKR